MELKIINYIEISGEEILLESLPEEKRQTIAEAIQDRMMVIAGYRRKPFDGGAVDKKVERREQSAPLMKAPLIK